MPRTRILIAGGEISILQIIESVLTTEGYEVLTATESQEALRRVEQDSPELVVLDIAIPELDGFEVLRRIRTESRITALPVILMSYRFRQVEQAACESMDAAHLTKPVSAQRLIKLIQELLNPADGAQSD